MFTSFARRLTFWYVAAAVALVALLLSAFAVSGLFLYVHLVQGNIEADAREAEAFSTRAALRNEPFTKAALEFEKRMSRPGVRLIVWGGMPHRPQRGRINPEAHEPASVPLLIKPAPTATRNIAFFAGPPLPSRNTSDGPPGGPPVIVMDARVVHGDLRTMRFEGSRFGFAIGTAFGAHLHRIPFMDGELTLLPDPNATGNVALAMLAAILLVSGLAGFLAWFTGRYITTQVLRPLVDVTHALQRFAARDFTPQPIAVAGKSEFDAIALAYNAASAQVAAAFAEREAAETQMRQFVADAGHELRTPLTIVLGYIDLLKRRADAGDERSRRIFSSISLEGARMRTLIDNLVLLAKMEGEDERPTEPFPLEPLLEDIAASRMVLVPSLQVQLRLDVDATVIGNRDEIYEAIANIVDNAMKYAPGSPIRIAAQEVRGGVELTISDDGPGIHVDDRAGIFDRFFRGSTRGEVEGSGLGLAIAKRAVERAGGMLLLGETSEAGTTFIIRLRVDQVKKREPQPARV
ncbi:MAG: histidine kinase [Candidatus Eremiobacteraeota bacterium]|nr:histidine kinase [Candidatus Eremiobacteraeota bacterium]